MRCIWRCIWRCNWRKSRPLLGAFWPEGITLRGVGSEEGVVVKAKGPSAGQSTMVMLFDTVLGVCHGYIINVPLHVM